MDCETGKNLHEKEAAATEAVGRYSRSLKGVAPAPEHRKEMDRLQRELAKAGVGRVSPDGEGNGSVDGQPNRFQRSAFWAFESSAP